MNVYDFDGTIYSGDSSVDFYLYCLKKQPGLAVYWFRQVWGICLHAFGRISTGDMKERFFSFLAGLQDPKGMAEKFWVERSHRIMNWYLERKESEDVVISASPEFLLLPICRQLGVQPPVATRMIPGDGKLLGPNCKGEEKVRRFQERFPEGCVREFFSDSLTDSSMARLAEQAFLVEGGVLRPWPA